MNIHELREAQARYLKRIDKISKERENLYKLRSSFTKYFDLKRIQNMDVDDYVLGVELPDVGYNFCYTIERESDGLGRIIGATAFKFGVYYGRTKNDENYEYRFTQKFGNNFDDAFEAVRQEILLLLDAGKRNDILAIANNILSPMFKGKILCTYFPNDYLNVFSPEHLNYFLIQLDLDTENLIYGDAVFKRAELVKFKNQDPIMRTWPIDLFSDFLYTEYPGRPPRDYINDDVPNILKDYDSPDFPPNPKPSFINLDIMPPTQPQSAKAKSGLAPKIDYEKEGRKLKKLGDRGEKIVMDLEYERLTNAGRNDLANKLNRVSLKSDSYGYDILSFETNGKKRYIEVKATTSKVGNSNFFFTINELKAAETNQNYYIYMVYDVTSESPKVWPIKNPFMPKNIKTVMIPINYRITINASKRKR